MPEATQEKAAAAKLPVPVNASAPVASAVNEEQASNPVATKVSSALPTAVNPDMAAAPTMRIPLAVPVAAQVNGESAVLPVQA